MLSKFHTIMFLYQLMLKIFLTFAVIRKNFLGALKDNFMYFHWFSLIFIDFWWFFITCHLWKSMKINENQWKSMKINGNTWNYLWEHLKKNSGWQQPSKFLWAIIDIQTWLCEILRAFGAVPPHEDFSSSQPLVNSLTVEVFAGWTQLRPSAARLFQLVNFGKLDFVKPANWIL